MPELDGTETHANLLAALARTSQTNRRYLWFAQQADIEGRPEAAALFRSLAESETGHALGHLEFLADVADPLSGLPIGGTDDNLAAAIAAEQVDAGDVALSIAQTARAEGFDAIADWFDTVGHADTSQVARLLDVQTP